MRESMRQLIKNPIFKRKETFLALIIIALGTYLSLATTDFLTVANLLDVLVNYSFLGIMSAGMLIVLISGASISPLQPSRRWASTPWLCTSSITGQSLSGLFDCRRDRCGLGVH